MAMQPSGSQELGQSSASTADATDTADTVAATEAAALRRKHFFLALKIGAAVLVVAAPMLVASMFWAGIVGVAFYGVLAATFGWIAGGPKIGVGVVASLAVLGVISMTLEGHTWALALILVLLGVLYGYAASRGVGKAVLQLPILTPYFMMKPPGLFSTDAPVIDAAYIIGVVVVMIVAGTWAIVVLHVAMGKRSLKHVEVPDPRVPLLYGTILGVFSAVVMVLGTTTDLESHWVWVTLTLYVLADPTQLVTTKKMVGRVLGTFAGFGVVTVLNLVGLPEMLLQILVLPAVWACLYYMIVRKPYWQYSFFLTVSVVLMNSTGINALVLNAERFGFTILGAGLSILTAFLVNLLYFHRSGLSAPAATK